MFIIIAINKFTNQISFATNERITNYWTDSITIQNFISIDGFNPNILVTEKYKDFIKSRFDMIHDAWDTIIIETNHINKKQLLDEINKFILLKEII